MHTEYYVGGHRAIMGGVPCRVASLPQHEGGKALRAESSRRMKFDFFDDVEHMNAREKKARRIDAEQRQREAYDAAPKYREVIAPTVERAVNHAPISRPVTRRATPRMSSAMRTINYYRVSTAKQGRSGLGLEAQRAAVEAFCAQRGCDTLGEYIEVESGRKNNRPKLLEAIQHAKVTGATLLIAKIDRLGRNLAFITMLQEAKVKFVAVDNPEANELTVHILAAMAQAEAKAISSRTKEALQAVKARGTWRKADGTKYKSGDRLGSPLGVAAFGDTTQQGRENGVAVIVENAQTFAETIRPIIDAIIADGHTSLRQIAAELDTRGINTARGGGWSPNVVSHIIARTGGR